MTAGVMEGGARAGESPWQVGDVRIQDPPFVHARVRGSQVGLEFSK